MNETDSSERAEPNATDNLDGAWSIREDSRFRSSPARCLSFIVRQTMKIAALAIFLLPVIARAATVEGAYFRLSADALVVDSVLVRGADSLHAKSEELRHSFSDYYLRLGTGRALVREGDVVLFDPDRPDAEIEFSHEEEAEGFRVLTMEPGKDGRVGRS